MKQRRNVVVACVSRRKHLPREATQALKSINDASADSDEQVAQGDVPVVINVAGSAGIASKFDSEFGVVDNDDPNAMEVEEVDEDQRADVHVKCVGCQKEPAALLEWENDGKSMKGNYCQECAEVVQRAVESVAASAGVGTG